MTFDLGPSGKVWINRGSPRARPQPALMQMWLVRNRDTGRVLAWRVRRADGWVTRLVGFLPRHSIAPEEGLWVEGCGAINTLGMRSALDVVSLARSLRVVRVEENVRPQRLYVGARRAHVV